MQALFTMGWAKLAGWLKRMNQQRTLAAQLEGMSDHQLHDIGLTREDIPALVRGVLPRGRRDHLPTECGSRVFNPCPLCGRSENNSPQTGQADAVLRA